MASDYFLCGRITYQLMSKAWGGIKGGPYLERMNSIQSWSRRERSTGRSRGTPP